MKCPTCGGALTLLLISAVCDRCEREPGEGRAGWVLWFGAGRQSYIWRHRADAVRYVGLRRMEPCPPIRRVVLAEPVGWESFAGETFGDRFARLCDGPTLSSDDDGPRVPAWPAECDQ